MQMPGAPLGSSVHCSRISRSLSTVADRSPTCGSSPASDLAVVALTMPRTRAENQVMGGSRDALIERASDSAQQLKEQVREKVKEVADDLTSASSTPSTSAPTGVPGM